MSRIAKIFENSDTTQERIYKKQNSWGKLRSPELSFDDVLKEGFLFLSHLFISMGIDDQTLCLVEQISFETTDVSSPTPRTPTPTALLTSDDVILR